jgi:hypothetical protein
MITKSQPPSPAFLQGYQMGLRDVQTGTMTFICGASQEAIEKAAGYQAGRAAAQERLAGREAGQ